MLAIKSVACLRYSDLTCTCCTSKLTTEAYLSSDLKKQIFVYYFVDSQFIQSYIVLYY